MPVDKSEFVEGGRYICVSAATVGVFSRNEIVTCVAGKTKIDKRKYLKLLKEDGSGCAVSGLSSKFERVSYNMGVEDLL